MLVTESGKSFAKVSRGSATFRASVLLVHQRKHSKAKSSDDMSSGILKTIN